MSVLVSTQFYKAHGESERRQALAMEALRDLHDVEIVDLQWEPTPPWRPWIRTVCDLRLDSIGVGRFAGRRKPIMSELMNASASLAERGGHQYFMLINADIMVTQSAIDLIQRLGKETYSFSRLDVHRETGEKLEPTLSGIDAMAADVRWWRAHHQRFRPYIIGELCWDCVYVAIAMCHSDGLIATAGEILHERHLSETTAGPYADYNGYLAALDSPYFSIWCEYYERLKELRARGAAEDEERALARATFVPPRLSPAAAAWQLGRNLKARITYERKLAAWKRVRPGTKS
jgi:hypothetical protein